MIDSKETPQQQCFALISANRQARNGHHLFGSEIPHYSTVSIQIRECKHQRDNVKDHYYGGNVIAEVVLTPMQWAEMLTNMNTQGVPCTLVYSEGKGVVDDYQPIGSRIDESYFAASAKMNERELNKHVQVVRDYINKTKLSKKQKEELRVKLDVAFTHLQSNAKFYTEQFKSSADTIVTESKAAVEANRQKVLEDLGLIKAQEIIEQKKLSVKATNKIN